MSTDLGTTLLHYLLCFDALPDLAQTVRISNIHCRANMPNLTKPCLTPVDPSMSSTGTVVLSLRTCRYLLLQWRSRLSVHFPFLLRLRSLQHTPATFPGLSWGMLDACPRQTSLRGLSQGWGKVHRSVHDSCPERAQCLALERFCVVIGSHHAGRAVLHGKPSLINLVCHVLFWLRTVVVLNPCVLLGNALPRLFSWAYTGGCSKACWSLYSS